MKFMEPGRCHILQCIICLIWAVSTASESCGGLQGDVVFVLDASGSVGYYDFNIMLQFVNDLVEDFDVGSDLVRVAVVTFDDSVYTELNLNDHYDKIQVQAVINNIYFTGGGTRTDLALNHLTNTMFTAANGDRSSIPNIAIIITDGQSTYDPTTQAANARNAGIIIFAIGVGTGVTELNNMATDPDSDHVFTVTNFAGLSSIEGAFQRKACTDDTFVNTSSNTGSVNMAAIIGGVVAGVVVLAAIGIIGGIVFYKMVAGKTAVSKLTQVQPNPTVQQPRPNLPQEYDPEMSIPGLVDAPAQVQPMDTRLAC